MMDDTGLTVNQMVNTISIFCERVENILHYELGMTKVSAYWIPRLLTPDRKRIRLITSSENLTLLEADPTGFLKRFLSQDQSWIHYSKPATKR